MKNMKKIDKSWQILTNLEILTNLKNWKIRKMRKIWKIDKSWQILTNLDKSWNSDKSEKLGNIAKPWNTLKNPNLKNLKVWKNCRNWGKQFDNIAKPWKTLKNPSKVEKELKKLKKWQKIEFFLYLQLKCWSICTGKKVMEKQGFWREKSNCKQSADKK